jgi:2-polyprenyl-6-methoxyphenol hydroxylase-like FAD-dependent oxidoreductase
MTEQSQDIEPSVIIAGGGLVGLSTAMFLAKHGVRSVVVERLRGPSPLPRAAHFHLRTLELFRLAGIEDEVRRRSEDDFLPDGAIVAMESLAGRKLADIIGSLNEGVEALSPCRRLFITQPGLEPILRRRAEQGGAQILDGQEIVGISQNDSGVVVQARDTSTGATRQLRSEYLVAADGAHSTVREALGIPLEGRGPFSNSMTIYFEADLRPYVGGKALSVIYINNPVLGGIFRLERDCRSGFLLVNTIGNPECNSQAPDAAKDTSEARLVELVRSAVGVTDLPVKINAVVRWRATATVARRYGKGRVFLAGDSAHLMPPNGGFGGNTGIHDAQNLAWKLAWVLKRLADPGLLATYEAERRPVGVFTAEQAYARYVARTAPYLSADDIQPIAPDFDVELGYLYNSHAINGDYGSATMHDDPHRTRARPGSRAPHIWFEQGGRRRSSLDLFGSEFVLLTAPQGNTWCQAAAPFAGLASYCVDRDLADLEGRFVDAYGISPTGAVLVRPDGFVGWRAPEIAPDPHRALSEAMSEILRRRGYQTAKEERGMSLNAD